MKKAFTSVRAFLAIAVVIAYVLAVLVPKQYIDNEAVQLLKDVVLIVVTFYFGQKSAELQKGDSESKNLRMYGVLKKDEDGDEP